ncbi:hypothetical protein LTR53_007446 [Teratosphaeriaceae sp. CCFEE 6253]|nr:hypothetical protein LTR53_007446 [Teratosphaeriaceae sp. CCFEE 6253]
MQSKEDVDLIRGLVDDYIKEKRTIVSTPYHGRRVGEKRLRKPDHPKEFRDNDPKGNRTIGIITKPDSLEPDSGDEASWIEPAENKDIFFELGWHILKNRSDKEASKSFAERNAAFGIDVVPWKVEDIPNDVAVVGGGLDTELIAP